MLDGKNCKGRAQICNFNFLMLDMQIIHRYDAVAVAVALHARERNGERGTGLDSQKPKTLRHCFPLVSVQVQDRPGKMIAFSLKRMPSLSRKPVVGLAVSGRSKCASAVSPCAMRATKRISCLASGADGSRNSFRTLLSKSPLEGGAAVLSREQLNKLAHDAAPKIKERERIEKEADLLEKEADFLEQEGDCLEAQLREESKAMKTDALLLQDRRWRPVSKNRCNNVCIHADTLLPRMRP